MTFRTLITFFALTTFIGCQTDSTTVHPVPHNQQPDTTVARQFCDILPDSLPDSLKSIIITRLIRNIDLDTTLIERTITDSLGIRLIEYYRNDTLVKVASGDQFGLLHAARDESSDPFGFGNGNFKAWYFLMNNLIAFRYKCYFHDYHRPASCNPVNASMDIYFHADSIIQYEEHDGLGYYAMCGCMEFRLFQRLKESGELAKKIIAESDTLKTRAIR